MSIVTALQLSAWKFILLLETKSEDNLHHFVIFQYLRIALLNIDEKKYFSRLLRFGGYEISVRIVIELTRRRFTPPRSHM